MNRNQSSMMAWAAVAALSLQGCGEAPVPTQSTRYLLAASATTPGENGRYVVLFAAERVPADFAGRVATLGGSVEASLDSIGVATVTGLSESSVAELAAEPDVRNVEPDVVMALPADAAADDLGSEPVAVPDASASPTSPTAAQFYARQWNIRAVFADQAWAAGFLGSRDVVVAILDSGIDYLLPDLAGLVDLEHSTSFVPEDVTRHFPGRLPFSDLHGHGTFVTSIVASNANVLAGINRYVTLIAVKINDSTRASSASRFLSGIMYAARSEEHTSELQSRLHLVCRLLLEKKKKKHTI